MPYAYGTVAAPVSTRLRQSLSLTLYSLHFQPVTDTATDTPPAGSGQGQGRVWGRVLGPVPYAYGTVAAPVSTRLRQSLSLTLYSLHFQPECRLGATLAATRVGSECGELATDRSMDLPLQSCTLYRNAPRDFYAQLQH